MPLLIQNPDGAGYQTKIIDTETGADITQALGVEYGATIHLDEMVTARLCLSLIRTEVVAGHVNWLMKSPATNQFEPVKHISFRDGTDVSLMEDGTVFVNGARLGDGDDGVITATLIGSDEVVKFRGAPAKDPDQISGCRLVKVHQPLNGGPLFNVIGPDKKPINARALPRDEAEDLARSHSP